MKKILSAVIMFCVMIFSANCQADTVTKIKNLVGTWYDMNGNQTLTISSDYSINGCKILDFQEYGGDANNYIFDVKIFENGGFRDIKIEHWRCIYAKNFSEEDFHEMIFIDRKFLYTKTKKQRYFESVGGIYLGMTKNQVLKILGNPTSTENISDLRNNFRFTYKNEGLEIHFDGGVVENIRIFDYGNKKFDKSGLSARDSIETYKNFYKPKVDTTVVNPAIYIGNGEEIVFSRNGDKVRSVSLCR